MRIVYQKLRKGERIPFMFSSTSPPVIGSHLQQVTNIENMAQVSKRHGFVIYGLGRCIRSLGQFA
jgi:hypothetical protein